jgi:hypothetical protein
VRCILFLKKHFTPCGVLIKNSVFEVFFFRTELNFVKNCNFGEFLPIGYKTAKGLNFNLTYGLQIVKSKKKILHFKLGFQTFEMNLSNAKAFMQSSLMESAQHSQTLKKTMKIMY